MSVPITYRQKMDFSCCVHMRRKQSMIGGAKVIVDLTIKVV